jgi:hypothetical protein
MNRAKITPGQLSKSSILAGRVSRADSGQFEIVPSLECAELVGALAKAVPRHRTPRRPEVLPRVRGERRELRSLFTTKALKHKN